MTDTDIENFLYSLGFTDDNFLILFPGTVLAALIIVIVVSISISHLYYKIWRTK